jgi:predicted AAA+ superfamily ATPase
VEQFREPGRFLILGSASRDLIRQSSETLAGRISYEELTPFSLPEIDGAVGMFPHWNRGGFPESCLASNDEESMEWRDDFIRTFLERDIPVYGPAGIPPLLVEKLWRLIAHLHGQTVNYSKMAESVDVSVVTLKKYLILLEQTFMIRLLQPLELNLKKRLVKSPKIYIRDSGLLHALLGLERLDDVLAHPILGASWEGYVIENLCTYFPRYKTSFLRTGNGAEMDLILEKGTKRYLIECKASKAPKPSRGTHELIKDLQPTATWLVAPVDDTYTYASGITVTSPAQLLKSSEALGGSARPELRSFET